MTMTRIAATTMPMAESHAGTRAAQVHEVDDHDDGEHHDGDELLGDAAGQMPEAVEDALPVLQMEEHRDAAHDQKRGRGDERRHLGAAALSAQRPEALGREQAGRPGQERGEQDKGPLQFHYSPPFQSRSRRM